MHRTPRWHFGFRARVTGAGPVILIVGRNNTRLHSVNFIRYRSDYQEPILALHRSAIEGFTLGMSQQQDEADLVAIDQVYLRAGGEFLIGFINEKLVAMGGFQRLTDTSAELRRMRIERGLQGQGYGTKLLCELERLAFQAGIRTICLAVARQRPLTLAFYRKHGYREAGSGLYGQVETVRCSKPLDQVTYD